MSLETVEGRPVHYPRDPNRFCFDEEVTKIFDDMADRSIPGYAETLRLTAALTRDIILKKWHDGGEARILDIGASSGNFYKTLWDTMGYDRECPIRDLVAIAVDSSPYMVERLRQEMPPVISLRADATDLHSLTDTYDVINMAYVMQFIPLDRRDYVIATTYRRLATGGVVLLSGKHSGYGSLDRFAVSEYLTFRKDNGYSDEEIVAKTAALAGSMWTETEVQELNRFLEVGFTSCTRLMQWLQFSTVAIHKD